MSNLVDLVYRPLNLQVVRSYNEEGNGRIGSALVTYVSLYLGMALILRTCLACRNNIFLIYLYMHL
jgi:hypothetical protein